MKLLRVELIQLHTHGHAIDALHVGLLESVLSHQSLPRVLLLEQLLLLPHCGHRLWAVDWREDAVSTRYCETRPVGATETYTAAAIVVAAAGTFAAERDSGAAKHEHLGSHPAACRP
jgi:hypothetical protein